MPKVEWEKSALDDLHKIDKPVIKRRYEQKLMGSALDIGHFNCSKIVAENPVGIEHRTFHGANNLKDRKYRMVI